MKVYVIIVTYNGMKWIDWCLLSLRQSTLPLIPVVIDNCSMGQNSIKVRFPRTFCAKIRPLAGDGWQPCYSLNDGSR